MQKIMSENVFCTKRLLPEYNVCVINVQWWLISAISFLEFVLNINDYNTLSYSELESPQSVALKVVLPIFQDKKEEIWLSPLKKAPTLAEIQIDTSTKMYMLQEISVIRDFT